MCTTLPDVIALYSKYWQQYWLLRSHCIVVQVLDYFAYDDYCGLMDTKVRIGIGFDFENILKPDIFGFD